MNPPSLRQTAARVRRGDITAGSVVEEAIRRHEESDLGAYIVFDPEGARTRARAIDGAVARGEDPGPLAGVTVSVKDLYGVEGLPIRAGTRRELPAHWRREGFLVRTVRELGAVIVGKTHTVELAFGGVGLNPNTGTPVNPWDADEHRAPGGSSAGAGVSLWEGSALIALGSDTGGSVRIPASATGVVGHRHTTGRWPTSGVVPLSTTLDTVGLLTRTAADSRYAFGLIDARAASPPGAGRGAGDAPRPPAARVTRQRPSPASGSAFPAPTCGGGPRPISPPSSAAHSTNWRPRARTSSKSKPRNWTRPASGIWLANWCSRSASSHWNAIFPAGLPSWTPPWASGWSPPGT